MMQWTASIWVPVIYAFEFAQTEQDISDPCVMDVRQAQRNHYNSKAATPENVTSNKFLAIWTMQCFWECKNWPGPV